MKELSIQEKAERYDKSFERAKEQLDGAKVFDYKDEQIAHDIRTTIYEIFPELKETTDNEKIRKEILDYIDKSTGCKRWVAWLEKQGEQKQDPCEHCKDRCLNCHNFPCIEKRNFEQGKSVFEISDENPTIEPKFKVGDWVVSSYGKVNQVIAVDEDGDGFTLDDDTYFSGSWKDNYHLWTILDAKDGDVLTYPDGSITLFKYISENLYMAHVLWVDGHIELNNSCTISNVHPATKEQRDALMKAMADAGYTFDFDKKELKKIEQNPAWSEEDEAHFDSILKRLEGMCKPWATYTATRCSISEDKDWLESLKDKFVDFDKGFNVGFSAAKHNQWKPSEGQMERLKGIINSLPHQEVLYSLYQDLLKLK